MCSPAAVVWIRWIAGGPAPVRGRPPGTREDRRVDAEPLTLHDLDCPRCGRPTRSPFHGPCDDCREQLRAAVRADARDVEAAAYEPKMNVTPNAVATKD